MKSVVDGNVIIISD